MNEKLTIEDRLTAWLDAAFRKAFPDLDPAALRVTIAPTAQAEFGDYQCNAAMGLARTLRRRPADIARAVADAAPAEPAVARVEVAGPGFLNLFLADAELAVATATLGADERLGVPAAGAGRTVLLDYSSPNVAKPMHVGHIRSTVIGNALDRLHRFLGYRVISDNHLGDWGTQFGILIVGYRHFVRPEALAAHPVEELERIYVESYARTRTDPEWLDRARAELLDV